MAPILYVVPGSPPVRAVQITADAIGVELEERLIDMATGENMAEDYLKMNPQHTVPTLVEDDGFTFWDSHAINTYLVSKYASHDGLYPRNLQKRAIVDQRLHFDSGVAYVAVRRITDAVLFHGKKKLDDADRKNIHEVYAFLEAFLEGKKWIAGNSLSVADYQLYSTVTSLNVMAEVEAERFPLVAAWLSKVDALPEVAVGRAGLLVFTEIMSKLG